MDRTRCLRKSCYVCMLLSTHTPQRPNLMRVDNKVHDAQQNIDNAAAK